MSNKDKAALYLTLLALPVDSFTRHYAQELMGSLRDELAQSIGATPEYTQNAFELVARASR